MAESRKGPRRSLPDDTALFRTVAETTGDAILVAHQNGDIVYCNAAAAVMFGYAEQELLSRSVSELIPQEYREAHEKGLKRFAETGQDRLIGRTIELAGRRKDETEFPLELRGSYDPFMGVHESPVGPQCVPPQLASQLLLVEFAHDDLIPLLRRIMEHTAGIYNSRHLHVGRNKLGVSAIWLELGRQHGYHGEDHA